MFPNALTAPGPYADLWSHLKAIQHALDRSLDPSLTAPLCDLDRDRLRDFARFLRENCEAESKSIDSLEALVASSEDPTRFIVDIDVSQCLKDTKAFSDWLPKTGYAEKVKRLIKALDDYTDSAAKAFVKGPPEQKEFQVLKGMLGQLLLELHPTAYA